MPFSESFPTRNKYWDDNVPSQAGTYNTFLKAVN